MTDSGIIKHTFISDATRVENTITGLQRKISQLEAAQRKLAQDSKAQQSSAASGWLKIADAVKSTLLTYVGVQQTLGFVIARQKEYLALAEKSVDPTLRRAQAQADLQLAMGRATDAEKRGMAQFAIDTSAAKRVDSIEFTRQLGTIFSSTSGPMGARIELTKNIASSLAEMFRFRMSELGEFGGQVSDIMRGLGGDKRSMPEVIGLLAGVRSAARITEQGNVKNLTPAAVSAGIMFGGGDSRNVQFGLAIGSAISNLLGDTTGELSRTAAVNFMSTIQRNPTMKMMLGPDASLQEHLEFLRRGSAAMQAQVFAGITTPAQLKDLQKAFPDFDLKQPLFEQLTEQLKGELKGRQFTKTIQEAGLSPTGLLMKEIENVLPDITFDAGVGQQMIRQATDLTQDMRLAADIMGTREKGQRFMMDRNQIAGAVSEKLVGQQGLFNTTAFGFGSSTDNWMNRNMFNLRLFGQDYLTAGIATVENAIRNTEAKIANQRGLYSDDVLVQKLEANLKEQTRVLGELRDLQRMANEEAARAREEARDNARKNAEAAANGARPAAGARGRGREG